MATVNELEIPAGDNLFYDQGFMNTLEDHMTLLRSDPNTETAEIEPYKAIIFEGDLFGLLSNMGLPRQYHWLTMRLNRMNSPTHLTRDMTSLNLPDRDRIERMKSLYSVQNKIRN